MKKLFRGMVALLALIVGLPAVAGAQSLVGAKGGIVVANLHASAEQQIEGNDWRTGAGFGVFFRAMVAPSVSVQPEVLYMTKGFKGNDTDIEGKLSLNYIQVPVLVQYHFMAGESFSPRIFAGPAIAFETSCKISGTDGSVDVEFDCEDVDIATKSADLSAVFGVGADIPMGGFTITGDARYDLGLSNIDDSNSDGSVKNRSWGFFLGAAIPVGS